MKKRKLYRYLSLISSLIIMFGMLNASAREYDDITDISVKNQLVSQSVINNVYTSSVTFSNLKRLKSILAKEENTESEQNRALLKELGYTEEELNTIGQEEIDMLMNSSEDITVSEQYIHFDEDSNMSIISKEQYQQNVIQKEKNNRMQKSDVKSASTDSNDGNNNVTENDMKIITTAFYVRPGEVGEKGWYWIAGMFSWLDTPTYTMTDAMSLFVSESSWSQNDEDYISRMTYNRMVQHQDITKITEDRVLNEEGLYYTWDLPDEHSAAGIPLGKVEDLTFYVRGKTRVSDFTNPRSFTVYTQYEHVYSAINIQPEFSWDILKHGVSAVIGIDFVNNKNSYSSFCGVDYDPDRNIKN